MKKNIKPMDIWGLVKFSITVFFFIHYITITFRNAMALDSIGMMVSVGVLFLLALVGLINEYRDVQLYNQTLSTQYSTKENLEIFIVFVLAGILTYLTAVIFDKNTIFAASVISLLMVYLIPERFPSFEITVYTGTISGMVGSQFIKSWPLALLFAVMAGTFYLLFQPSYRSTGGRAGLMSYMTSLTFMYLILDWRPEMGTPISRDMILISFILTFVGAYVTYLLHMNNIFSVVKSAMIVTLIFDLVFPQSLSLYTTAGFVGTIVAMTTPTKTENIPFLSLITFFSYLVFVPSYPLLGGTSGKLGLVALTGYLASDGLSLLVDFFNKKISPRGPN